MVAAASSMTDAQMKVTFYIQSCFAWIDTILMAKT